MKIVMYADIDDKVESVSFERPEVPHLLKQREAFLDAEAEEIWIAVTFDSGIPIPQTREFFFSEADLIDFSNRYPGNDWQKLLERWKHIK